MNKLLRQFSSDEFEALINQMKGGNIFEDLTSPIDTNALAVKPDASFSIDKLMLTFESILDTMAGTNKILSDQVSAAKLKEKENSSEISAITQVQSNSDGKRKIDQLKEYGRGILDELKRIVEESGEGGGGLGGFMRGKLPRISGRGAAIAAGGAAIIGGGAWLYNQTQGGGGSSSYSDPADNKTYKLSGTTNASFKQVMDMAKAAGAPRPEIVAAQWALESAYGKRMSGKNNPFGQKATKTEPGTWRWTTEVINGRSVKVKAKFKDYETLDEAIAHHVRKWNIPNTSANMTPLEAAKAIKAKGYATDPKYVDKIMDILASNNIDGKAGTTSAASGKGKPVGPMADVVNMVAPGSSTISSGFGQRKDPFSGRPSNHNGIDLPGKLNSPVNAIADGIVDFAGWKGGYGNTVIVEHPDGKKTLYAHLNYIDKSIKKGEKVSRGATLGGMGTTGTRSTGVHLHFEVIDSNGAKLNPMQHAQSLMPKPTPPPKKGSTKIQPVIIPEVLTNRGDLRRTLPPPAQKKKAAPTRGTTFPNYYQR